MAKKIFCDVCGDEMTYDAVPTYLKHSCASVKVKGQENRELEFSVAVNISPVGIGNGEHVDICGDCRAYLLDKLDVRPKLAVTPADQRVLMVEPAALAKAIKARGMKVPTASDLSVILNAVASCV